MKSRIRHCAIILAITGGLLTAGASAANATVTSVGGGTWDYGVNFWISQAYSNYYHPQVAHGSTACNSKVCSRSDPAPRGVWSKASIRATWGGNTAYWRK